MAGLDPAIHVGPHARRAVDARDRPGHDTWRVLAPNFVLCLSSPDQRSLTLAWPGRQFYKRLQLRLVTRFDYGLRFRLAERGLVVDYLADAWKACTRHLHVR